MLREPEREREREQKYGGGERRENILHSYYCLVREDFAGSGAFKDGRHRCRGTAEPPPALFSPSILLQLLLPDHALIQ